MLDGIRSGSSSDTTYLTRLLGRLDTDSNGSVSKTEFVAGRPKDVDSDTAGSLFDSLDSSQSGALSVTDLASAFQQMTSAMQSVLIQAQTQTSGGGASNASTLFDDIDSDSDGTVSREEFVSARPDDVSEEQATALFNRIAGDDSADSVSREQFAAAMPAGPPPGGPPPGGGGGGGGSVEEDEDETEWERIAALFDQIDSDSDGTVTLEEFVSARPGDVSEAQATTLFNSIAGTESSQGLSREQFAAAMPSGPPPGGPPPGDSTAKASSETQSDSSSTSSQALLDELLKALASYQASARYGSSSGASSAAALLSA